MRETIFLTLFVLLFAFQSLAQEKKFDETILSEKGKEAYKELLNVELFALGGIGYGGVTSNGERALFVLIEEKAAISVFKYLVKTATPEGGLYALLGLKILGCDCFKQELGNFRKLPELEDRKEGGREIKKGNVRRMQGCLGFQENRLKVASDLELEKEEFRRFATTKKIGSAKN